MDIERYRKQLMALEQELRTRLAREVTTARDGVAEQPDAGDQSMLDEIRDEYFTIADTDTAVLHEVREALTRIDNGTFGRCVVDGAPIEEKRLEAVPWTPYCQKHQQKLEGARSRAPTL